MHDDADGPRSGRDRHALNDGGDDGEQEPRPRPEQEGADQNGDVGGVVFQKRGRGEKGEVDEH